MKAKVKQEITIAKIMKEGAAHSKRKPYYFWLYAGLATSLLFSGADRLGCRRITNTLRIQWGIKGKSDENLGVYYAARCIALGPEFFKGKFSATEYRFEPVDFDELVKEFFKKGI